MARHGKILLHGQIECLTPLHIGSGSDEHCDLDILLDPDGTPFIPATSFIGVLRHATTTKENAKTLRKFWGFTNKSEGQQSLVCCADLRYNGKKPDIVMRDGIKIDPATGIVKDTGKYDYELIERGARFDLRMEFTYQESNETLVKPMAATIYDLLCKQHIRLGAKTNSGFGAIRLVEPRLYAFDFSNKCDVFRWLAQKDLAKNTISAEKLGESYSIDSKAFNINASFWLKHSLIVRSYSNDPNAPDAVHITSHKVGEKTPAWVLPGTSLKGAIRARAERIVNTIGKGKPPTLIDNLFGYVREETKDARKGKIRIEEAILPKFVSELQTRIKIDRFTGGTIESALFDTMPVFGFCDKPTMSEPEKIINLQIHIEQCEPYEAGLLLLVLKDLWTGDLAVGGEKNVGRGVFQGILAKINYNDHEICLDEKLNIFCQEIEQPRNVLEGLVQALNAYQEEKQP